MSNYEEHDFCPFPEISLEEYEKSLNELYRVEMQNGEIEDDDFYAECAKNLTNSVMRKLWENNQYEISEEEVCIEIEKLLIGKLLDDMDKNGQVESTIDENGEVYYRLTEDGRKLANSVVNEIFENDKEN